MEAAKLFIGFWMGHIVLSASVVAPLAILGRRRARWQRWEVLAFVLPYWTWAALMLSSLDRGKSLANLGEWFLLCPAIIVTTVVRVWLGHHPRKRLISGVCLTLLVFFAVGVFALTTPWPE